VESKRVQVIVEARLLDRKTAAAALSISVDTLDKLRKQGLPTVNIRGVSKPLFDLDDVVEWLKDEYSPAELLSKQKARGELDDLLRN